MASLLTPTGHEVLVDDDLELPGSVSMSGNGYPQVTNPATGKSIPLHQFIMDSYRSGKIVDHKNRNKLDNRRSNLRFVDPTTSSLNTRDRDRKEPLPRNVYRNKKGYLAQVNRHNKRHNLGTYATPELAAEAAARFKEEYDG